MFQAILYGPETPSSQWRGSLGCLSQSGQEPRLLTEDKAVITREEKFENMRRGCPLMTPEEINRFLDGLEVAEQARRTKMEQFTPLERVVIIAAQDAISLDEMSMGMGLSTSSAVLDVLQSTYLDQSLIRFDEVVKAISNRSNGGQGRV